MTSKVYGNRIPTTGSNAAGKASSLRRSFTAQPSIVPSQRVDTPDPSAQEETAETQGHNFARLQVGAGNGPAPSSSRMVRGVAPTRIQGMGAGGQASPLTGAGGVIQAHSKAKPKKKETTAERQKRTGLKTGKAFALHNIQVERKPHDAGPAGAAGSSRAAVHDHGNAVAITAAKNKAIRQGKVKRQDFQSSVVRSKAKAAQARQAQNEDKKDEDAPAAAASVGRKKLSKAAQEHLEMQEYLAHFRQVLSDRSKKPADAKAEEPPEQAAEVPAAAAAAVPAPKGGDDDGDADASA